MNKIVMLVRGDLSKDARVARSAEIISKNNDLILFGCGKTNKALICKQFIVEESINEGFVGEVLFTIKILNKLKKYDYNILFANDIYTCLVSIIVKKMNKNKVLIYDAHELFIPQKSEKFGIKNYFYYFFEKMTIKNSNYTICASDERAMVMKTHYKLKKTPLVIRNISYLNKKNQNIINLIIKNNYDFFINKEIIVYAGVVSKDRELYRLVELACNLKNVNLLIIGNGNDANNIKNMAKELGNKFLYIESIEHINLINYLSLCTIGYLYYSNNTLNNRLCAPNKIYEYASAGLPIICNENNSLLNIINSNRIGLSNDNYEKAYYEIIENINDYKVKCKEFCEKNSWVKEAEKLQHLVGSI